MARNMIGTWYRNIAGPKNNLSRPHPFLGKLAACIRSIQGYDPLRAREMTEPGSLM